MKLKLKKQTPEYLRFIDYLTGSVAGMIFGCSLLSFILNQLGIWSSNDQYVLTVFIIIGLIGLFGLFRYSNKIHFEMERL